MQAKPRAGRSQHDLWAGSLSFCGLAPCSLGSPCGSHGGPYSPEPVYEGRPISYWIAPHPGAYYKGSVPNRYLQIQTRFLS